jgi:hypothetical protein
MKFKPLTIDDFDRILRLPREKAKECLRQIRVTECFDYADRASWFASLTEEQKQEVLVWRQEWCDVTETFVKPVRPHWIKY